MKAVVYEKFGAPEVLQIKEIDKPKPKSNEVLIKVLATSVHRGDTRMRNLDLPVPFWQKILARVFFLGIFSPRKKILGMELSGILEEVGNEVTQFNVGDEVFASTFYDNFGAYVEYKCMADNSLLANKPNNISFEEAATVPNGAFTALGIIKEANIKNGQTVLIYGASGSVGSFAVQFAKNLGAFVTGVSSKIDMVKDLGADKVIDYTKVDFSSKKEKYDVIIDAVGIYPKKSALKALKKQGVYLNVHNVNSKFEQKDLVELRDIIEAGLIRIFIDKTFSFHDIAEGHRYVERGHKMGHVAVSLRDIS